jgi:hypothetical protein
MSTDMVCIATHRASSTPVEVDMTVGVRVTRAVSVK